MKKNLILMITLGLTSIVLLGCQAQSPETPSKETKLTVGIVQKEIKKGMSQADVASVLGSPNIVTSEEENKETWVYDKISSRVDYQQSDAYGTLILVGISSTSGNTTTSQRTLTVIIKFNQGKVYDYKYHSSSF